jgi:hypothetical protein
MHEIKSAWCMIAQWETGEKLLSKKNLLKPSIKLRLASSAASTCQLINYKKN